MNRLNVTIIAVLMSTMLFFGCFRQQETKRFTVLAPQNAVPLISVTAAPVGGRPHELTFIRGGVIVKSDIRPGIRVVRGDTLMAVETRELRAELNRYRAAVDEAHEKLQKLKNGDKAVAEQNLAKARIEESAAGTEVERADELFRQGSMSSRTYDSLKRAYARIKADRIIAESNLTSVLLSETSIQAAVVQQAEFEYDAAAVRLSHATLIAPATGVISDVYRGVGEVVEPGVPVMQLIPEDTGVTLFKAVLTAAEVQLIEAGQHVVLKGGAGKSDTMSAIVFTVAPVAGDNLHYAVFFQLIRGERSTPLFQVYTVTIRGTPVTGALLLPSNGFETIGSDIYATCLVKGNAERCRISVVPAENSRYIVTSGLSAGDTVLLTAH